jgi:mutator protein MutT
MATIDVTAAIIEKDGKILIAQRKKGKHLEGKWEFPGGKVESGETPEECLKRELLEEFGIEVEIRDLIGNSEFDYGDKHIRLLGYRAQHLSGEFQLHDHDDMKWIRLEEFAHYDFAPADLPLIDTLCGK